MNSAQYTSTARALASPQESPRARSPILPVRGSTSPLWSRRSLDSQHTRSTHRTRSRTVRQQWLADAIALQRRALKTWGRMPAWQRAAAVIAGLVLVTLGILFLIFSKKVFHWLGPARQSWRELPGGWAIVWALTFVVSFPPLIGYSLCVTVAGFVFGMKGWFIMSTATVVGSTASFVVSRTLLRSYVARMTERDRRFAALSLVLKHDGLKLLCMIRLCPLPYSFANGAISTIPSVTWPKFMLATAIATPKLLLHIFIGSQLGELAEEKMDWKTKMVSYITIAIGVSLGIATGYIIYVRTKARAEVLEAEEAAAAANRSHEAGPDYNDDPDEEEAVNILRQDDDISLPAYDDGVEGAYRDEFTDDEDARERDVFDIGDGDDDDEEQQKRKR